MSLWGLSIIDQDRLKTMAQEDSYLEQKLSVLSREFRLVRPLTWHSAPFKCRLICPLVQRTRLGVSDSHQASRNKSSEEILEVMA